MSTDYDDFYDDYDYSYDPEVEERDMNYPDDDPEVEGAANNHGQNETPIQQVLSAPKEKTMSSNVRVIARPIVGLDAFSLKVGEYARITDTNHNGHIVLRTRNVVVNITDPSFFWDDVFGAPVVERLNIGDKLEITVGFTTEFEQRIADIANGKTGSGFNTGKIAAIKAVREATNWGLKESKDYVESLLLKF